MKENSGECYFEAGSLTKAIKLQNALAAAAIPSKLVKTGSSSRRGCSYSLSFSCAQENNVRTVIKSALDSTRGKR